jgi:XTP/dITP diphosphohydrolase
MSKIPARGAVIATHNAHKVKEIRKILGKLPVPLVGLDQFPDYDVRETGKTLEANALLKARAAVRRTGLVALSDDTGLEVKALKGAPGVYSARYAGPKCSFEDNNRKLLKNLEGKPLKDRGAVFRCVVAVVFPDGRERVFEGRCPGRIIPAWRGTEGFGYDPVFQPKGSAKTFAEMSLAQKNKISHRFRAFQKAARFVAAEYRRSKDAFLSRRP